MNFGVFGGSFDPPHVSHALACLWAVETGEVDRVLVVPCGQHALGKELQTSFDDRMEMCRRAFARLEAFVEILDIEGRRGGASYTVDTLRALQEQRPGHGWRLLIGSDILEEADRWKSWEEIERRAPPLVIPRMTAEMEELGGTDDLRLLSSTWLRDRLEKGDLPPGLIAHSVLAFIQERGLYRSTD